MGLPDNVQSFTQNSSDWRSGPLSSAVAWTWTCIWSTILYMQNSIYTPLLFFACSISKFMQKKAWPPRTPRLGVYCDGTNFSIKKGRNTKLWMKTGRGCICKTYFSPRVVSDLRQILWHVAGYSCWIYRYKYWWHRP